MSGKRLTRGRYDPADKTARLIRAAAAEVGERGIAGATVPRVSARAGVSRGLVHYHFPNTAALVHAVARAHFAEWGQVVRTAADRAADPAAVGREVVAAARALVGQHPTFWSLHAALVAGAHQDVELANIVAAAQRDAAGLVGPVDALVCGFAIQPAARTLDTDAWAALERAVVRLLETGGTLSGP